MKNLFLTSDTEPGREDLRGMGARTCSTLLGAFINIGIMTILIPLALRTYTNLMFAHV